MEILIVIGLCVFVGFPILRGLEKSTQVKHDPWFKPHSH